MVIMVFRLSSPQKSVLPKPVPYDEYDPFAHRSVEKPTSWEYFHLSYVLDYTSLSLSNNSSFGSFIHLVKSSLGMGIFAMPMAFKHGGYIFGLIATVTVGIICTHCIHLLVMLTFFTIMQNKFKKNPIQKVSTSHKICKKTKTPSLRFAETAEMVFANGPVPFQRWSFVAR